MAAASLTLVGFLQPYLLELFLPREAPEKLKSAMSTLGTTKFFLLALILVWVYCLLFFTIESFGFFNWLQWLYNVVGTTALTVLVLMTVESIRR